uniref:Putative guanyl-nucleotide exchange factor n=1 Tax=Schistosoma mansoni TaxID=6183 RepID=A0A3Q0KKT6_SCHMA
MNSTSHSVDSSVIQASLFGQYNRTGDPTSLWCDESLENPDSILDQCKCYTSTPSSFSTTSESTSYSRDLYVTSRLRSRSEEKNCKSEHSFHPSHSVINYLKLDKLSNKMCPGCVPCSSSDDKLRFSVYSEEKDDLKVTPKDFQHGNKLKRKENQSFKSSSSVCYSDDSDSVPPAMALINVNRLHTQALHPESLNKNRIIVTNKILHDFNNELDFSGSKLSKTFLNTSRKSLPAIHLDRDLEISGSSGTSSLSYTAVIVNETEYIPPDKRSVASPDESNEHYLTSLHFGQTGASARDSGLSSHSSNSVNYSPNSLVLPHKRLVPECKNSLSPTPPPVPRHAPQSQVMVALTQRNGNIPCETDLTKCTCSKGASSKMAVERIRGTTIRLHSHTGESKTLLKSYFPRENEQNKQNLNSSLSPIWKRKSNTLQSMIKDKIQLIEEQNYSKSIQITKSKEGGVNKREEKDDDEVERKGKHLINKVQYENTTTIKNDNNHDRIHNSCLLLNDSTKQQDICTACTLNWQFYLSQPCSYTFIDNMAKCYHDVNNAWYFVKHDCFLNSTIRLFKHDSCFNCRKHIYAVGVNLFNRNPLRGLKYLARHNFLNLSSSKEVSKFIQNNADLCRSKIGAFLGLPPTDEINPTEVTMILLKSLNISGLEVDEALRLVVHRYGMPVESQEIDRLLQCVTEYYHTVRWCSTSVNSSDIFSSTNDHQLKSLPAPPISPDQLSLIFYAILLLQTSLHNVNAAKSSLGKQNVSQFIKNVHDLLLNQPSSSPSPSFMAKSKSKIANHNDVVDESGNMLTINTESILDNENNINNNKSFDIKHVFSNRTLTEIFHRIKVRPLEPGSDQTTIVRHISKAIRNLQEVKILNIDDIDNESLFTNNPFELVEPHRRLVCYCTVVHINQNQPPHKETSILRHLFVFNDLIIIAKDTSSKRTSGRRLVFDKSRKNQLKINDKKLSPGQYDDFLRPPLDLLYTDCDKKFKIMNTGSNTLSCIQPTVGCVPHRVGGGRGRRSRSKNELYSRKAADSTSHSYTRLTALYVFSLYRCKIRPFKTDVYRYGIELWKFPKSRTSQTTLINQQPEQMIIIAALDKNDYENLLNDLYQALCETNLVAFELK